jgi:hypothetical protein
VGQAVKEDAMSQSLPVESTASFSRIGSPLRWLEIVFSVWFVPEWYHAKIHSQLPDRSRAKWLVLQSVLGATLISVVGLIGTWAVGQWIESLVPVRQEYLNTIAWLVLISPALMAGAATVGGLLGRMKSLAAGVPAAAGFAFLGVAYFVSMLGALTVLLFVPIDPSIRDSARIMEYPVNLIFVYPQMAVIPMGGLLFIETAFGGGATERKFFRFMQKRYVQVPVFVAWITVLFLNGSYAMFMDSRYYFTGVGDLFWPLMTAGWVSGLLCVLSVMAGHWRARGWLE